MRLRLLGSGTSSGVPRIGNDWGACNPGEPRNYRTRVSALVETETTRILIDTGPDLRYQLNQATVATVDAILWTHDHADHTHGIDDVRQLFHNCGGRPVPGYARPQTRAALEARFSYVFGGAGGYRPTATIIDLPDRLQIGDIAVRSVDQPHGSIHSAGLRFDCDGMAIVYATDFNRLTDEMRSLYQDVDCWVLDVLRREPHPTHPHLAQALEWIAQLRPRRAVLIHMDNSMDYARLRAELPDAIEPGYDGMVIE